jgi:hypothetical protein
LQPSPTAPRQLLASDVMQPAAKRQKLGQRRRLPLLDLSDLRHRPPSGEGRDVLDIWRSIGTQMKRASCKLSVEISWMFKSV